jgi:hypothetical protein
VIPDPWAPQVADPVWFGDPVKRANFIALLERHNENLYTEACDFYASWRAEIDPTLRISDAA